MSLNLHLLRLFAAVARHGSFSRAAEALHVSQPAVSRGVREFEDQVGNRLLERKASGVIPTEAGRILLRHASALFAAERAAEEDLAALRGLTSGSLSIGASTTISSWFLPSLLGEYHQAHPAIKLQLRIANTSDVLDLLLARELDVALVEGPAEHHGIIVRPWQEDRLVWVAASSHPLAKLPAPLALDRIADELILVREPGSGTREVAAAAMAAHGFHPREMLEVGSTEAIKHMVAAGIGIALISAAAIKAEVSLHSLIVLNIKDFTAVRMLNRLSLLERHPTAAAAAFERLLDRYNPNIPFCTT
jgi:DNA-binding transcriptional LysR family regulator